MIYKFFYFKEIHSGDLKMQQFSEIFSMSYQRLVEIILTNVFFGFQNTSFHIMKKEHGTILTNIFFKNYWVF